MLHALRSSFPTCAAALSFASMLAAQCPTVLAPTLGIPGCNGEVRALVEWDPDGGGPRGRVLVMGGAFTVAHDAAALGVAIYDPVTGVHTALSTAADGIVDALVVMPNNDLVAAGQFTVLGGVPAAHVARFDGTSWHALGSGTDLRVDALAVLPNGDLAVGGDFTVAGGVAALRVARFDGTTWHAMGSGANSLVRALAVRPNGELVAGGDFLNLAGTGANYVARWNGTSWSPLTPGIDGPVNALRTLQNGDLAVGGVFTTAGVAGTLGAARWNGTAWSAFGAGLVNSLFGAPVFALAQAPNGDLVAAGAIGAFAGVGAPYRYVARFDGTNWLPCGTGTNALVSSATFAANGDLYVGGVFLQAGSTRASRVARWNGTSWSSLGTGIDFPVVSLTALGGESFLAGGSFGTVPGVVAPGLARFDGAAWNAIGTGPGAPVTASIRLANGNVLANVQGSRVLRFDGVQWAQLPPVLNNDTSAFAALTNGDVVLGGGFTGAQFPNFFLASGLAVWNGTQLQPFAGGASGGVYSLLAAENNGLYVGGSITQVGGSLAVDGIAFWNGTAWSSLGTGIAGTVFAIARAQNGDVIAGGAFLTAGGVPCRSIARWNGTTWSPLGSGLDNTVRRVVVLPNGDVVAAGLFRNAGTLACEHIARWDGTAWHPFGTGTDLAVDALAVTESGDLLVGGQFSYFDQQASPYFARLQPACRATATPVGTGCLGSSMTVRQRAWAGGTCVVRGEGLPTPSLVVVGTGFNLVSLGIDTIFPQGIPGCTLLLVGDPSLTQAVFESGGVAEASLAIPRDPVLVGVAFRQQMVPVQFGGPGSISALTTTNAIDHVVGSY